MHSGLSSCGWLSQNVPRLHVNPSRRLGFIGIQTYSASPIIHGAGMAFGMGRRRMRRRQHQTKSRTKVFGRQVDIRQYARPEARVGGAKVHLGSRRSARRPECRGRVGSHDRQQTQQGTRESLNTVSRSGEKESGSRGWSAGHWRFRVDGGSECSSKTGTDNGAAERTRSLSVSANGPMPEPRMRATRALKPGALK